MKSLEPLDPSSGKAQPMTSNVTFSVIIPTYNRAKKIKSCLQAIVEQNYPKHKFEVIVVNDGGCSLEAVVQPFTSSVSIRLVNQENAGPAEARNRGAIEAVYDFLAFTDDDCYPDADWLQRLASRCCAHPQALIGGHTVNQLTGNWYSTASQWIVDVAYRYYNSNPDQAKFFASNNMVFPRRKFLKLGGFHPHFRTSEDRDICDRWLLMGYPMIYDETVRIAHAHPLNLSSFWKQHLNYGRGAFNYHNIRAHRGAAPFQPDFSFYGKLLRYPFECASPPKGFVISFLMGLSQVASAVGYLLEKTHSSVVLNAGAAELFPLRDSANAE